MIDGRRSDGSPDRKRLLPPIDAATPAESQVRCKVLSPFPPNWAFGYQNSLLGEAQCRRWSSVRPWYHEYAVEYFIPKVIKLESNITSHLDIVMQASTADKLFCSLPIIIIVIFFE